MRSGNNTAQHIKAGHSHVLAIDGKVNALSIHTVQRTEVTLLVENSLSSASQSLGCTSTIAMPEAGRIILYNRKLSLVSL